jgi:hypothetical protein
LSVTFPNGDSATIWPGETFQLHTFDLPQDILASANGIEKINLTLVALVVQICNHLITPKKIVRKNEFFYRGESQPQSDLLNGFSVLGFFRTFFQDRLFLVSKLLGNLKDVIL